MSSELSEPIPNLPDFSVKKIGHRTKISDNEQLRLVWLSVAPSTLACMKKKCPNCETNRFLKKILYGMPSDDFDRTRFHVGGCIPSRATVHCSNCDWEDGDAELTGNLEDEQWVG